MSANVIGPLERRDSKTLCAGQSSTSFQDQERVGTFRFNTTDSKFINFFISYTFLVAFCIPTIQGNKQCHKNTHDIFNIHKMGMNEHS